MDNSELAAECPSCGQERGEHPLFCQSCRKLFPEPEGFTHFDRLGLQQAYDLAPEELEQRLLRLSRWFHPDFFASAEQEQQDLSLQHSSSLNAAFAVLRDPFQRAEYLLELLGAPGISEDKRTPTGFLEEMLFLREELEEAIEENDRDAVEALHSQLCRRQDKLADVLRICYREIERGTNPREYWNKIRMTLNATRYITNMVRDSSSLYRPA